jgi:hypothetical protein
MAVNIVNIEESASGNMYRISLKIPELSSCISKAEVT